MPTYSGDWLLTGEGADGTSTEVADLAGEKGTGEGLGGTGSASIISSRTSTAKKWGWGKKQMLKYHTAFPFLFPFCKKDVKLQ